MWVCVGPRAFFFEMNRPWTKLHVHRSDTMKHDAMFKILLKAPTVLQGFFHAFLPIEALSEALLDLKGFFSALSASAAARAPELQL